MVALAWVSDRGNPKVGLTVFFSLIPAGFVYAAGFLGQAIGIAGRDVKNETVTFKQDGSPPVVS
jgi:hypothetical protein